MKLIAILSTLIGISAVSAAQQPVSSKRYTRKKGSGRRKPRPSAENQVSPTAPGVDLKTKPIESKKQTNWVRRAMSYGGLLLLALIGGGLLAHSKTAVANVPVESVETRARLVGNLVKDYNLVEAVGLDDESKDHFLRLIRRAVIDLQERGPRTVKDIIGDFINGLYRGEYVDSNPEAASKVLETLRSAYTADLTDLGKSGKESPVDTNNIRRELTGTAKTKWNLNELQSHSVNAARCSAVLGCTGVESKLAVAREKTSEAIRRLQESKHYGTNSVVRDFTTTPAEYLTGFLRGTLGADAVLSNKEDFIGLISDRIRVLKVITNSIRDKGGDSDVITPVVDALKALKKEVRKLSD